MRDVLFFVADTNASYAIRGFLERPQFHLSIGCGAFEFDPSVDLRVANGQNDPGIYARLRDLVSPYAKSHRRIVVVMDAEWDGAPRAEVIRLRLHDHLETAGWEIGSRCVVVVEPEIDAWVWTDTPHTAAALGWRESVPLRTFLEDHRYWPADAAKPPRPKEAMELIVRKSKKPRSSSIYRQIASNVSIQRCVDPGVRLIVKHLQTWFPPNISPE